LRQKSSRNVKIRQKKVNRNQGMKKGQAKISTLIYAAQNPFSIMPAAFCLRVYFRFHIWSESHAYKYMLAFISSAATQN
jgi:hypothetical protein